MKLTSLVCRCFLSFLMVLSLVVIGGCGGKSSSSNPLTQNDNNPYSDDDDDTQEPAEQEPASGTFVRFVENDSSLLRGGLFDQIASTVKVQFLYYGANASFNEINGAGNITAVSFKVAGDYVESSCPDVTIKMGHSSLAGLTNTFANNVDEGKGSYVTVLNGKSIQIPALHDAEYFSVQLDKPFYYNGRDNLVVEVYRPQACTENISLYFDSTTVANRALYSTNLAALTGTTDYGINMKFHFKGGDNLVTASDSTYPISASCAPGSVGRTQSIIRAADINGTGPIIGMAIPPSGTTPLPSVNMTGVTVILALCPDTMTSLNNYFQTNLDNCTSQTTVVDNMSYNLPRAMQGPLWIPFNNSEFEYDGTSNILIDVTVTTMDDNYYVRYYNSPEPRMLVSTDPSTEMGALIASPQGRVFHPTFRFKGASINFITAGTGGSSAPFKYDPNKKQMLYSAAELGAAGETVLNKIALRLYNQDSVADTYNNFEIKLAETDDMELTDTFADNMTDAVTVYNGNFSVPNGLRKGDWIEIPFATAFNYNGTKNLVVQFATDAGAEINYSLSGHNDDTYLNRNVIHTTDRTAVTGTLNNYLSDIRFWVKP
ncbi:MAG: hypothetical protein JXA66_02645 [Oligoflexia bacterium]|nr:hypothetical protein [Oligoflexia bacterium]